MTFSSTAPDFKNWNRSIVVVLIALVAYRLASAIPIFGINVSRLGEAGAAAAWDRFSIMALGFTPWLSALLLAELAVLILPKTLTQSLTQSGAYASPFSRPVLALALVIAASQAYGVSVALLSSPQLIIQAEESFVIMAVASLVGGAAIAMLLGRWIDNTGIAPGFWVVVGFHGLSEFTHNAVHLWSAIHIGAYGYLSGILSVASTCAAVAAVVVLIQMRHSRGLRSVEPIIWPLILAGSILPWIAIVADAFFSAAFNYHGVYATFLQRFLGPYSVLLWAPLIAGFVWLYARREGDHSLVVLSWVVLTFLSVRSVITMPLIPVELMTSSNIVIVTTMMFLIVKRTHALNATTHQLSRQNPSAEITDD